MNADDALDLDQFTRWDGDASGSRVAESSLRIVGMHCAACAGIVERALARIPGVLQARVSAAAACATVRWDPARTQATLLLQGVRRAGYEAVPDTAFEARALRGREARTALWRLFVAALCAMQIMMLASPSYLSAPGDLAPDLKQLLDWGSWLLTLPVLCFAATPFFAGAWRALRQRRIGMDVPVALGIAAAFVASSGAAFAPGGVFGHEVWFDSLTMFVAFLLAGRYLEMGARHRAEVALERTSAGAPELAMRLTLTGAVQMVATRHLQPGDRVRVPLGQSFAADGVLIEGASAADESLLSGESRPVPKAVGDALIAGSVNLLAPVVMRVERVGPDTRYEAIVALMRAARTQRPALLAAADRWAAPFLWAVLVLAAAAGAVWSVIDPARAVGVVVAVLVVTCPCALSLAAPSALLAAAGAMGRRGLLLRHLDAITGLARMQTLFVDKTGTLTEQRMQCVRVHELITPLPLPPQALHSIAASLAAWSSHPLAVAVRESSAAMAMAWRGVHEQAGAGVEGTDAAAVRWRLGSAAWCGAADGGADGAATWLARDGRPLLRLQFDEQLRDGAVQALQALAADGVQVCLLSGDDPARVTRMAARLGLAHAIGGAGADAKLAALRAAQLRGEFVAMLGDGVNDAPVLAQADVSIAIGEGAAIARGQADGVLISNRLPDLVRARALARRTVRVVRQNMVWAAAYNAACIPLALAGWLPPWAAGLGMAASSSFVVLNSLRLAR